MKAAQDIIIKPIITEHSMEALASGKYTFKVAKDANKIEIAKAVETLFKGVKVAKVNTISVRGRLKRMGSRNNVKPRRNGLRRGFLCAVLHLSCTPAPDL